MHNINVTGVNFLMTSSLQMINTSSGTIFQIMAVIKNEHKIVQFLDDSGYEQSTFGFNFMPVLDIRISDYIFDNQTFLSGFRMVASLDHFIKKKQYN
jgi:hypothetical protein